jgi:hypothetical protein
MPPSLSCSARRFLFAWLKEAQMPLAPLCKKQRLSVVPPSGGTDDSSPACWELLAFVGPLESPLLEVIFSAVFSLNSSSFRDFKRAGF